MARRYRVKAVRASRIVSFDASSCILGVCVGAPPESRERSSSGCGGGGDRSAADCFAGEGFTGVAAAFAVEASESFLAAALAAAFSKYLACVITETVTPVSIQDSYQN